MLTKQVIKQKQRETIGAIVIIFLQKFVNSLKLLIRTGPMASSIQELIRNVTFGVVTAMLLKIKILWTAPRAALLDPEKGRHHKPSEGQQLRTSEFGITLQKTRKIN
jgi:hypothetical protein